MREGLHTADPPGGLQKQSRALRGRQSSADSNVTSQYNSSACTIYQLSVGLSVADALGPAPPDERRTTYSRSTRRTTEAEQSTERKTQLSRLH